MKGGVIALSSATTHTITTITFSASCGGGGYFYDYVLLDYALIKEIFD